MPAITTNKPNRTTSYLEPTLIQVLKGKSVNSHSPFIFNINLFNSQPLIPYIYGQENNWSSKEEQKSFPTNTDFKLFCPKAFLNKIFSIGYTQGKVELNLQDFSYLPSISFISLALENNNLENLALLKEKMPNLTNISLAGCNITSFEIFKQFPNLTYLNLIGNPLQGEIDVSNLTKLRFLSLARTSVSRQSLDNLVAYLYQAGNIFAGTGKALFLDFTVRPSGNIGDSVNSGTGQGFVTGLIDEFGWTVIQ